MREASFVVLCAGYGTRLRPLTDELPKPLVPIGDRPILGHILAGLSKFGFSRGVINTHHLAEPLARWAATAPIPLDVVHEPEIRGTAGGLTGALPWLREEGPVLLLNGDIWVEPPVPELLDKAGQGLALAVAPRQKGQGTVGLDSRGRVVRLRGHQFGEETQGGDYVGVAAVGPSCRSRFPSSGCLVGDVALPILREGGEIATAPCLSPWTDVGDLHHYLEANLRWLRDRKETAWVHPQARVSPGITLEDCVVGAHARISGEGKLTQVVVWPGAQGAVQPESPLCRAAVTTSGLVVSAR